jgi:Ti-type conjugative transfer relaxase TraA
VRVALPKELSLEEQVELVQTFCKTHFLNRGLVVDFAIHHDNMDNPHAHIGLTTRPISSEGFGPKDRSGHTTSELRKVREGWSLAANHALQQAGHAARIDHRSYEDQGLRVLPSQHVGINRHQHKRERRDLAAERLAHNDAIAHQNGEAIRKDPTIALEALTHHEATFTRRKVAVWLSAHTFDAPQFQACLEGVMGHGQVIQVGSDADGVDVFSTRSMLATESRMLELGAELAQATSGPKATAAAVQAQATACGLSEEQTVALRHVTQRSGDLALVEGLAGAGKSTLFQATRQVWVQQRRRVVGMALSGKAAEGLCSSSGITDCRSIAAWEWAWGKAQDPLRQGDVVVVDEAGMVGTRQMGRLLEQARKAGAQVVLAGDSEQLQAVEAGSPFAELGARNERVFLRQVRRQQETWQRQATEDLARGDVGSALMAYKARGAVHGCTTLADACDALTERHAAYAAARPGKCQLALSVRKAEVAQLNACIRAHRAARGELGPGRVYATSGGPKDFAQGDRLCFLRNDPKLGVKNGTLGTVQERPRRDAW